METPTVGWTWLLLPYVVAAVLGACVGSFANVLIFRLPRDLSIVAPRSFCPSCRKTVAWFDNVPIVSWLLLRRRCRHCGVAISRQYPLIELLGASIGLLAVWRFGYGWTGLTAFIFLVDLLVIASVDWKHMIIPHTLTVSGMVAGLLLAPWNGLGLGQALLGGAAGVTVVLALAYGYKLLRGQVGMGGGDVMLMGLVGVFLGPLGVGLVLFGGALLGSFYVLVRYHGSPGGQSKLPFGTFLAGAAALALLVGDAAVAWYLSLVV